MPSTPFYCYSETGIRKVMIRCDGVNSQLILEFLGINAKQSYEEAIPLESIKDMVVGHNGPIFKKYQANIKVRNTWKSLFLSLQTHNQTYGFECANDYEFYQIKAFIDQAIKMNSLNDKFQLLNQLLNETIMTLKQSQVSEKLNETPQEEPLPDDIYQAMYC